MEDKQKYKINWKRFIVFSLVIGFVVGLFSVKSDYLTYFGESGKISVFDIVLSYLAVMINSLPMWFIVAMIVGYLFGKNVRGGIMLGAIYTVIAVTFYFVIGSFYDDALIQVSFKEQIGTFASWYGASVIGGCIGGGVGFLFKKTPYVLLILIFGLIIQLIVNGTGSWNNIVGVAQNVTFSLLIVCIVYFLITAKMRKQRPYDFSRKQNQER